MSNIVNGSLIPTGRFCTVEYVNFDGSVNKLNGRTGVKAHKSMDTTPNKYFLLSIRKGSIKSDRATLIPRDKILGIACAWHQSRENPESANASTL